jgi:hypothetical protein
MITKCDMGWHRIQGIKNLQKELKNEKYELIDKEVYLKNGLKVNIEYTEYNSFIGLVTKGNDNYEKGCIINVDFQDIDNTKGKVIPIDHEKINQIADELCQEINNDSIIREREDGTKVCTLNGRESIIRPLKGDK